MLHILPTTLGVSTSKPTCGSEMGEGLSVRDGTAIVEALAPDGLDLINLYNSSLKPKLGGNNTPVQQVGCC